MARVTHGDSQDVSLHFRESLEMFVDKVDECFFRVQSHFIEASSSGLVP